MKRTSRITGLILSLLFVSLPVPAAVAMQYVSGGSHHSAALPGDGTVKSWGSNINGQLGNDSTFDSNTPVQTFLPTEAKITSFAGKNDHTLALQDDGTVWAWGFGQSGQLGTGDYNDSPAPVKVTALAGKKIIAVAASNHSMALQDDGTVWAWGYNYYGQIGNGTASMIPVATPVQVSALAGKKIIAIAAGDGHSVALQDNGAVWCWGWNASGQLGSGTFANSTAPATVAALSGKVITAIAAGAGTTFAIQNDGSLWGWGDNSVGQVGDGSSANKATPQHLTALSGKHVTAVSASLHTLALVDNGSLWAWGGNNSGQLGNGKADGAPPLVPNPNPAEVSAMAGKTVVEAAAGRFHTLVVLSDGSVWSWGENTKGQLGDNTTAMRTTPVQVPGLTLTVTVPANGVCGSSNGGTFPTAPIINLCSTGTATSVTGSGPWNWSCQGSNGGTTATCSAQKESIPEPVNGVCGSSNGGTFSAIPTTNLCSAGTATTVTGSGPWSWSCQGSNNGTNVTCSANKSVEQTVTVTVTSPTQLKASYRGGKGTIAFAVSGSATPDTIKSLITADNWITIGAIKMKGSSGTIPYSITANPGLQRTGAIHVATTVITVTQDTVPCKITAATVAPATVSAAGGEVSLNVTVAPDVCSWSVLGIKAGGEWLSGFNSTVNGSGTSTGTAAQNSSGKNRSTSVTIQTADGKAKKSLTVKQLAK